MIYCENKNPKENTKRDVKSSTFFFLSFTNLFLFEMEKERLDWSHEAIGLESHLDTFVDVLDSSLSFKMPSPPFYYCHV